ncbi:hypothetical protein ABPG74_004265 [Tetrahymena malaccensis]
MHIRLLTSQYNITSMQNQINYIDKYSYLSTQQSSLITLFAQKQLTTVNQGLFFQQSVQYSSLGSYEVQTQQLNIVYQQSQISDHIFIPSIMAKSKEQVDNKNSLIQSELNSINLEEQEKESNKEETPKSIFYTKKSTLNINSEKEQNIQQSSWLQKSGQNQNKKQAFGKAQNKTLKLQKQSSKKMEFSMTFSQIIQTDNPFITNQCNNDKTLQNSQLFQQKQVSPQQYQTERLKKFQDQNKVAILKIKQKYPNPQSYNPSISRTLYLVSPNCANQTELDNVIGMWKSKLHVKLLISQYNITSMQNQINYIDKYLFLSTQQSQLTYLTAQKQLTTVNQGLIFQSLAEYSSLAKQINDTEQNKAKQVSDQLISPLIKAQSQEQIDKKSFLFINQINFSNSQDEQKDQNKDESPKSIFYTKQNTQNSDFIKEENILQNSQKRRQIHQLKKYELAKNKSQGIENENIQQKKKEIATTFSSVIKTETPLITNQKEEESYLQKQLEIFSSFELQSQKIQSYISRCSNSDNLCEIDQRILSSIFKI